MQSMMLAMPKKMSSLTVICKTQPEQDDHIYCEPRILVLTTIVPDVCMVSHTEHVLIVPACCPP